MTRITGSVTVEERASGRVWVAKYMRASGTPTRKVLGPAWVKDSGRRTSRAAIVWKSAGGHVPDGHLTPRDARDRLTELQTAERILPQAPRAQLTGHCFGEACEAYLQYVEIDKAIATTTLRRYEGIVRVHLQPAFKPATPLARITHDAIDRYRTALLNDQALSRSAMRQHLIVLNGIFKRAQRRRWISRNPMADIEQIRLAKASGDFNVLEPAQVESVAQAAATQWERVAPGARRHTQITGRYAKQLNAERAANAAVFSEIIRVAAFTGLRLGELRAVRWRDINTRDAIVHVRENSPTSAPAGAIPKAPKSQLVRSVPLSEPAADALERLKHASRFTTLGDHVFPSPGGALIEAGVVRGAFYTALKDAGLGYLRTKTNPMTFHDLRHTFGTLAVRVFPLTDVQAFMGHADISTTMRYVHHIPRHDAADLLSAAFAMDDNTRHAA